MNLFVVMYGCFVALYGAYAAHTIICHYRYFLPWQRAWEQAAKRGDMERMEYCFRMEAKAHAYGLNPLWFRKAPPELPSVGLWERQS